MRKVKSVAFIKDVSRSFRQNQLLPMYQFLRFFSSTLPRSFVRSTRIPLYIYHRSSFHQTSINSTRPFRTTAFVRASTDRTPFNSSQKQSQESADENLEEKIEKREFPELFPNSESIQSSSPLKEEEDESSWYVDPSYNTPSESIATVDDFIPLWQRRARERELKGELSTGELTPEEIVEMLEENRMEKVSMIDLKEKSTWAEYMFIAESKAGEKFLGGVAEEVALMMKKRMHNGGPISSPKVEGLDENSDWLLIDGGRYVVHLFTPDARIRYNLEGLWENIPSNPMLRFVDENTSEEELKARVNESLGIAFGVLKEKN